MLSGPTTNELDGAPERRRTKAEKLIQKREAVW
jgi:hypothetical protein